MVLVADTRDHLLPALRGEIVVHALELVNVDIDALEMPPAVFLANKGLATVQDAAIVESQRVAWLQAELKPHTLHLAVEQRAKGQHGAVVAVHGVKGDALHQSRGMCVYAWVIM